MAPSLPPNNTSTPATPKRVSVFSANYNPASQVGSSTNINNNNNRYVSPSKKRQLQFGTPPVTRTPLRVAALPNIPATPRTDILKQLPEPPQIPEGRVGYDPELRNILSHHEESLSKLIDRYSRLKLDLSHQLNLELADSEHQRTNAKCELAVVQKQLAETVESNEKLKNELTAARNRLNKLTDDRRGMELKLGELNDAFELCREKFSSLDHKKKLEKQHLGLVVQETKKELDFLEEITGLSILIVAPDRLKFNFKLIDMNAYDRVFSIELDLSDFDYKILSIDPPCTEINPLLKKLNQTRNFNRFLCDVRLAFKKTMKT
ncbi:kinetochore-associated Ndc80 complex subunit spc25 [Puccinia graminis f. sp. tritici]|uniref:Kinetochore protein SPC25 n=1 Tax=Puccinia graminis f. sp. tritici TaxID=56615 RepID=A0A5B0RWV3_PUCGR|nr:kinetochore-associated Ndc80 complex subunit spc25 [Puccinia graminis f. sp. tritici]